jgi:undecaprenyl-diphosphatase
MVDQLLSLDRALFFAINNGLAGPVNDIVIGWATWLGNALVLGTGVIPLLYLIDRKNFRRNLVLVVLTVLLASIIGWTLKHLIDRPRPLKDMADLIAAGKVHIHVLFTPLRERSMPSGHTVVIFSAAASLSFFFHRYAVPLFLIAILTGLSRVYVGAHYPSDVAIGALIGILSAVLVHRLYHNWFDDGRREPRSGQS